MGGNDSLIVSNLTPFGGAPTTQTYAGSLFDGGDGIDALSVNGVVQFQGTLQNIERLYFNPAFVATATAPGQTGQAAANLVVSGATLNQLPHDLGLFGDGTLTVNLQTGEAYNGSGYTALFGFNPLIDVRGTAGNDVISMGAVREIVNGGAGFDTAVFAGSSADYIAAAGVGGAVLIGGDSFTEVEFFRFADGTFFGTALRWYLPTTRGLSPMATSPTPPSSSMPTMTGNWIPMSRSQSRMRMAIFR